MPGAVDMRARKKEKKSEGRSFWGAKIKREKSLKTGVKRENSTQTTAQWTKILKPNPSKLDGGHQ